MFNFTENDEQERMDSQALQVFQEIMDCQALKDLVDLLESLAHLGFQEPKVIQVSQVLKEPTEFPEIMDQKVPIYESLVNFDFLFLNI